MAFPVKWFTDAMRGAPVISGTAGSRIAALDACLRTGFGSVTPSAVTVAGGVTTATVSSGQTFHQYAVILVEGADGAWAGLNGEARVISDPAAVTTQVQWATSLPDGTATGAITLKYAPLGWDKPFEDAPSKVAVFKSVSLQSNGHFLRIDDTDATNASVRGYEVMTDANTGTDAFPTTAQAPVSNWYSSYSSGGAAVRWVIVGDDRFFMFCPAPRTASNDTRTAAPVRGFGDLIPLPASGDAYSTAIAYGSNADSSVGVFGGYHEASAGAGRVAVARSLDGSKKSELLYSGLPYIGSQNNNVRSGTDTTLGAGPSTVDGSLKLSPLRINVSVSDSTPRADVPGLFWVPQSIPTGRYAMGELIAHAGGMVIAIPVHYNHSEVPGGVCAIDVTGPWR